ncbi:MAG: hypothetical protein HYS27_23075 [Deltaproteobacteria bacterium]|nr:hypothetical protein [Deltaproteobacteria bacterium]
MIKAQSTCIAVTTDVDTLSARVGHGLDIEADIWAAWDAARAKNGSASEPIFRLGEIVGANRMNEPTNLLVLLVEGTGAERIATRLAPALEARWKQRVLVEGAASPDGTQRRLRRSAPIARTPPMTKQLSGYAFAVEGARADFVVKRAVASGTAPRRRITIEGSQDDVPYEVIANEDHESEGSFRCTWTDHGGGKGTASLDLMSNSSGDLVLVGPYTSNAEAGFWAFRLVPDDDDDE